MTDKPHNSDLSSTWPQPTQNDEQYRVVEVEEDEAKRAARDAFLAAQHARRAKWRQRRGWDTP